jgi:drug/metabolite transporter (DMT)-like permease
LHSGHIFMFLGLLSFGLLGVFHKLADVKEASPKAITAVLYLASLVFVLITLIATQKGTPFTGDGRILAIGLPFGLFAGIAILAFQAGIRHGDITTSWLVINLSSAIPTVASILIYKEAVTPTKAVALILIPIAILLLWKERRESDRRRRTIDA